METRPSMKSIPRAGALRPSRRPAQRQRLIAFGGLACIAGTILLAAWSARSTPNPQVAIPAGPAEKMHAARDSAQAPGPLVRADSDPRTADATWLVDDDGRTQWESPTQGEPLTLAYLPPGVQIVLAFRPAALASHPEGEKVLASLGPLGEQAVGFLRQILPLPERVEQCIIGFQVAADGRWQATLVARLKRAAVAVEQMAAQFPAAAERMHNGRKYWLAGTWAYYLPNSADNDLLVVAPASLITESIDLDGDPPPLRRDMERLLAQTDADRHVTVLFAPNYLFSEGQSLFSGSMGSLRSPLFWFLGDELSAVAVSMHWDESFFIELRAAPTLDTSPARAAALLAQRVAQIPDRLEALVVQLEARPYGQRVVARFPAMVRQLATNTRTGVEAELAVLRCYLPSVAGHNLLMASELTLAESSADARSSAPESALDPALTAGPPTTATEGGVGARLRRLTSLSFPRDTLEEALRLLSQDTGVEIVIRGTDLQAEGITKNQSFGINMADQPAESILVEVLRRANPDKTATGPDDERQKLVYVISPTGDGQTEQIVITTRSAAAARGDTLPQVFRTNHP